MGIISSIGRTKKFIGFKEREIQHALQVYRDSFNDFEDAFVELTQQKFVLPMSDLWFCDEAVDFFRKFKEKMDQLNNYAIRLFRMLFESVNSSGKRWALDTGNSNIWKNQVLSLRERKIDVSRIRNVAQDGARGIDIDAATGVVSQLLRNSQKCQSALNKLRNATVGSGFLGGSQEENLLESIDKLRRMIEQEIEQLFREARTLMEKTSEKYGSTVKDIATGLGATLGASMGGTAGLGAMAGIGAVVGGAASAAGLSTQGGVGSLKDSNNNSNLLDMLKKYEKQIESTKHYHNNIIDALNGKK